MSTPVNPPANPGRDVKFGLWTTPESPIVVEYSLVAIEEIRHEVAEGYQRLSRGGIEVGGVLYGTHDGGTVRVLAMRPIACEHARGPGFLFSDKDRAALHEQLLRDLEDPHLKGLVSVGWFLSHTRSEIMLSESDLEIYSIFFPSPWQVTLVVRPGRNGSMRGGFFVRETSGEVQADHTYSEFNFPDRLAGLVDRPVTERRDRERRAYSMNPPLRRADRAEAAEPPPTPEHPPPFSLPFASPPLLREQPTSRRWPWLIVSGALVFAFAILGLRYWMVHDAPEPISLAVAERDGQLRIEWNSAAKPVVNAVSGSLEITDGTNSQTVPLNRQDLAAGRFTYARTTGDIEVRMVVQDAAGATTQEASRYLGRPPDTPKSSQELADLEKRRGDLELEVQRLRHENDAQAAKIQQLERLLRVLQSRLGIDSAKQ